MSISPLGCVGIPEHADDEHAAACQEYFASKHDECVNVNQALSTAKCVISRFQGDADEQAGMCACMEYYEALALSILAAATHHGNNNNHGNADGGYDGYMHFPDDDACGQCNDQCYHDHGEDLEQMRECNEVCDEQVCGSGGGNHNDECNACHDECIEGDEACHTICDGNEFCMHGNDNHNYYDNDNYHGDDYFHFDDDVLHECHDECDVRFCIDHHDAQGEGSDVDLGEDDHTGAHEADTEEEVVADMEHLFADDECYICHTDCVSEIFGSGFGSGDTMPPLDEEEIQNMQCHDQCEEQFPMTVGDWNFEEGEPTESCHECHEECSETVDEGTEESTACHMQCDTSMCIAGSHGGEGGHEDEGHDQHTDESAAHLETKRPRRAAAAASTTKELRRRSLHQNNNRKEKGTRSRRYIENMQCHVECDGEGWETVYGYGADDGATIGDSAVEGVIDEINSAIAASSASTGAAVNVLALGISAVVAAGLA